MIAIPEMAGEEKRKRLGAWAEEMEIPLLFADGLDDAIMGIGHQFNTAMVIYSRDKVIEIFMERDGMDHEEAEEMFSVNVIGAWVGEHTPMFLTVLPEDL